MWSWWYFVVVVVGGGGGCCGACDIFYSNGVVADIVLTNARSKTACHKHKPVKESYLPSAQNSMIDFSTVQRFSEDTRPIMICCSCCHSCCCCCCCLLLLLPLLLLWLLWLLWLLPLLLFLSMTLDWVEVSQPVRVWPSKIKE